MHFLDENDNAFQVIREGIVYLPGRDRNFRPIIVIDTNELNYRMSKKVITTDEVLRAFSYYISCLRVNMLMDYYVENMIIILDTKNMSLFGFPFKIMSHIIKVLNTNFCCTMEKLFILNPSTTLYATWKVIEAMLDHDTAS